MHTKLAVRIRMACNNVAVVLQPLADGAQDTAVLGRVGRTTSRGPDDLLLVDKHRRSKENVHLFTVLDVAFDQGIYVVVLFSIPSTVSNALLNFALHHERKENMGLKMHRSRKRSNIFSRPKL